MAATATHQARRQTRRTPDLPALRLVPSPRGAYRFAKFLAAVFIGMPFFLLFTPWQQSIAGSGRVIDFEPDLRQQTITAPIEGRVMHWHVAEGDYVEKDAPIVDIQDNDPELIDRLKKERAAIVRRRDAAEDRVARFASVIAEQKLARDAAMKGQHQNVLAAEQRATAARKNFDATQADQEFAKYNSVLEQQMFDSKYGLTSDRDRIRAAATNKKIDAELERAKAGISQADADVMTARATLDRLRADEDAKIANSEASKATAMAEVETAEQAIQQLDVRIRRQQEQHVKAPVSGWVFRVEANAGRGGQAVKAGDPLVLIVPEMNDPVVELFIDGNDAPLVTRNKQGEWPKVRLQFEGWPAVQFVGWPSAARGTFGGRVIFVDSHADVTGRFRVLVKPDRHDEKDEPWPQGRFLRQGNRANGWVFLEAEGVYSPMVPAWWELWRRLNGFPPVVTPDDPGGVMKGGKDGKDKGEKPKPKVK